MVRVKNRYVVVEINVEGRSVDSPLSLQPYAFYEAIIAKIQQLHGDYGVALVKTGFTTKYCNQITRIALLKIRHGPHTILLSSLPFVNMISDKAVVLNTLYVGATMKHCFKFIKKYQINHLYKTWKTLRTEAERKAFREAILDFESADQNNIRMT